MPTLISGKLHNPETDDFSGFLVTAFFEEKIDLGNGDVEFIPRRLAALPSPSGDFEIEIPEEDGRRGPIRLVVHGRDGLPAGEVEIGEDGPFEGVVVDVLVCDPTLVETSPDLTLGAQLKYTGRAIDPTGHGLPANLLVVVWARAHGAETESPVSVASTAEGGYFAGPWPSQRFSQAFAVISGGDPLPIPLEASLLPRRMVLVSPVIPVPTTNNDGCDCRLEPPRAPDAAELAENSTAFAADSRRCVDFTLPNRTVEEVAYQAVVRTTQPELKGVTPPPQPPIPQTFIRRLAELAQARPIENRRELLTRPAVEIISAAPVLSTSTARALSTAPSFRSRRDTEEADRLSATIFNRALAFAPGLNLEGQVASLDIAPDEMAEQILETRLRAERPLKLEATVLAELAREPGGITPQRLLEAEHTSVVRHFRSTVELMDAPGAARFQLEDRQQLDWDANPDAYQATTIAHGHLLTLKQVWRADGYSLGDLLYSLPLAPGQQKLISTLDWSRTEISSRRAQRRTSEQVEADLVHDRDVNDIIRSTLSERMDAESHAGVKSFGGALGGFIGPLVFGAAGGVSSANSSASQTSARSVTGSALNRVRDRTLQSASAVRSQRTSVVQTARQGESVRAQTEVVANNNHCHAITVEYFEVLRHFQVSQELAHVQECLFIPFAITSFNQQKAMRWREILRLRLRRPDLADAFDALERQVTNWRNADSPPGRYADDPLTYLDGDFTIQARLPRPADDADGQFVAANWEPYREHLWAEPKDIWDRYLGVALPESRNAIWDYRVAPGAARRILEKLKLELLDGSAVGQPVSVDPTLIGTFGQGRSMRLSLRAVLPLPAVTRAQIQSVRLSLGITTLPPGAEILFVHAAINYRTDYFAHPLFAGRRILNDLTLVDTIEIATPLDTLEKRNPRQRDRRDADRLIDHLNEHVEYYHRAIWLDMDPNRRYMLLDGFIAPDAGGRSVASVVENRVIGIVGNCLVMPVAPGQQLDCTYEFARATFEDLRNLYAADPAPPMRISVPTSGVFAEAVAGKCNSCETIDDTLFWRWEEAPIPDQPTLIAPLSTDSRRTTPPSLAPDQFPEALVRLQQTPAAPAPTGLAAAVNALGVGNIFKDLTGLALNQENAAEALKTSIKTAQGFATKAAALAQQKFLNRELDRGLENIKAARQQGLITKEQARERAENLLRGAIGEQRQKPASPADKPGVQKAMERVPTAKRGSLRVTGPEGTVEVKTGDGAGRPPIDVQVKPQIIPVKQPDDKPNTCWAAGGAMMASWKAQSSLTIESVLDSLGGEWRARFDRNEAVSPAQARAFFAALGLIEEGPASYTPEGLARLLAAKGPLLDISDDAIANNRLVHLRIITAVSGEGAPERTTVTLADSASGTIAPEPFAEFDRRHAGSDAVDFGLGLLHF